jgi:GNAT superfamily N-acetyltransferase
MRGTVEARSRRRTGGVQVSELRGRGDRADFISLPSRLYRGDPHWVPPLRYLERRRWSPRHNPSLEGRPVARFLARRGGVAVGRIAAVLDPAFSARWLPGAGFFGFFEAIDDREVAGALLRTAEEWLVVRGARSVVGPVNLSTHDEVGLLVEGFARRPTLLSPYNAPFYGALVEGAGYQPLREYHSWLWTPEQEPSAAVQRLAARLERRGARGGAVVRSFKSSRWDEEVEVLRELYNGCFEDLWGFVPIRAGEMAARAAEFRPFHDPELAQIAEVDGRPVGFGLVLPDVNEALARAGGRLLPLGWLRLMRAMRRIRTARFLLLGVLPEWRGKGIAPLLAAAVARAGRERGIREAELSLIQGENDPMRHVVEAFGCPRIRTFRLYWREL